jgi:hypothetical protein
MIEDKLGQIKRDKKVRTRTVH